MKVKNLDKEDKNESHSIYHRTKRECYENNIYNHKWLIDLLIIVPTKKLPEIWWTGALKLSGELCIERQNVLLEVYLPLKTWFAF